MTSRIHVITLGTRNIDRSRRFYEALGWKASSFSNEQIIVFQNGGGAFCLFPIDLLAEDAELPLSALPTFRGSTMAQCVASKEDVVKGIQQAIDAGGTLVKPAQEVFWGGFSGYFADPDGHLWEIAWNPFWPLQNDGSIKLPL